MSKKILIHSIVFSPDAVSTAYLYNDIALKFKSSGYEVVVITTTPHYNLVPISLEKQSLTKRFFGLYYESNFFGIRVIHVPQKKYKSAVLRILGFLYWHLLSFFLILFQKKISIILSPSPPLTIGFINIILGKIKDSKVIYNVQEIYPDFLTNQGKLTYKPVVSVLKWLERIIYNNSDAVTTIDKVFYDTISPRFNNNSNLYIIPNFVDTDLYKPILKQEMNLDLSVFNSKEGVLKIMYAGNIGHAQDWLPLITCAKNLLTSAVEFWVIGEGVLKSNLEEEVRLNNLTNVKIVPYQAREHMPSIIAYADLHFIFMTPELEGDGFPSKVYTIMACSKPLLVVSGVDTPISNFLNPIDCAFLINDRILEKKCEQIIEVINKAIEHPELLEKKGANGFNYILKNNSKEIVTQNYVDLVDEVILGQNEK